MGWRVQIELIEDHSINLYDTESIEANYYGYCERQKGHQLKEKLWFTLSPQRTCPKDKVEADCLNNGVKFELPVPWMTMEL